MMKSFIATFVTALLVLVQFTNGLHFYLKTGETRCFFEELSQDTLVVGKIDATELTNNGDYVKNHNLQLQITVEVSTWFFLMKFTDYAT